MSDENEPAVVSRAPAINGGASVTATPPPLAPALAQWVVDEEKKTSTATLLGGVATISRSPKNSKFMCEFKRDYASVEDGEEGAQPGSIQVNFPLNDCTNLRMAQLRAETVIRENMGKTHPELLKIAMEEESAAVAEAPAGEDPF